MVACLRNQSKSQCTQHEKHKKTKTTTHIVATNGGLTAKAIEQTMHIAKEHSNNSIATNGGLPAMIFRELVEDIC